ncbi:hypothetical protein P879_05950, partial [Paragonimus westermani]
MHTYTYILYNSSIHTGKYVMHRMVQNFSEKTSSPFSSLFDVIF